MAIDNEKERIVQKLINNEEDLTEDEISFMLWEFEEVRRENIGSTFRHFFISSILKIDEDLYYEIIWLRSKTQSGDEILDGQPRRVKDEMQNIKEFVRYDD